jgi:hypothetical protein
MVSGMGIGMEVGWAWDGAWMGLGMGFATHKVPRRFSLPPLALTNLAEQGQPPDPMKQYIETLLVHRGA